MSRKAQVLPSLPDDFVDDRGRNTGTAKTADGQIIAIVNQPRHGILDGGELVRQGTRLGRKIGASVVGRWVREEFAVALRENVHGFALGPTGQDS